MPMLNMSSPDVKERIKALHENLDKALSCLGGLQQPMTSTSPLTKEDEARGDAQMQQEMYEAVEMILTSLYGQPGVGFVFKV